MKCPNVHKRTGTLTKTGDGKMSYTEVSRLVVSVASIVVTSGLYHQAYKVWRTKSVNDFTWSILVALLVNELAWLNYGLAITEWPIVLITAINLPAVIALATAYIRYRKEQ